MNLYLPNGYLNMYYLYRHKAPFVFIVAARGTGKTYGGAGIIARKEKPSLFLRRTDTTLRNISSPATHPFKTYNEDTGHELSISPIRGMKSFAQITEGEELKGYACALSTFKNIRGIDLHDIDLIFYDEFIGESHDRPLKDEGDALANLYESVNRNRELSGAAPVKLIAAANSNRLDNPIFNGWGLTDAAEKMARKGQDIMYMEKRGILIVIPKCSPISELKKKTALYAAMHGTKFEDMAIGNEFAYDDTDDIKTEPLIEHTPVCVIDDMVIYEHKSTGKLYLVDKRSELSGVPSFRSDTQDGKNRIKSRFGLWFGGCIDGRAVSYQNYLIKSKFIQIFA